MTIEYSYRWKTYKLLFFVSKIIILLEQKHTNTHIHTLLNFEQEIYLPWLGKSKLFIDVEIKLYLVNPIRWFCVMN